VLLFQDQSFFCTGGLSLATDKYILKKYKLEAAFKNFTNISKGKVS
jgi:hypothetical protein